jgi:hypothetical protein
MQTNKYKDDQEQLKRLDEFHAESFMRIFMAMSDYGRALAISRFNKVVGECVSLGHKITSK